ncbi:calretinin-like isoform X2 [Antedon mediterranea]|uniref:calretinin-like isoform X1 n=1 Tax=Antedon mediterranea TaxID=105859 RepID=UPI003AF81EC1
MCDTAIKEILEKFHSNMKLHCTEFIKIWKNYDTDKSNFIEAKELKNFVRDLLASTPDKVYDQKVIDDYTETVIDIFDMNNDGKFSIHELAKLLPVEENFVKQFQNVSLTEFEAIFQHYDYNNDNTIKGDEITAFVKDVMNAQGLTTAEMKDIEIHAACIKDLYGGVLQKENFKTLLLN